MLHNAGDRENHLYFLTAGIVSRFYVTANGASAAFAVTTGSEGVIGVASFLGGESMSSRAQVLCAGYGYRLAAELLDDDFEHDGPLQRLLLRYTRALITHIGQIAVCNRHHSLEQQLCRWILSCADRLPADTLTMTHERIADMLGVRREGVTEAAGRLQRSGLIHCGRGRLAVQDRFGLEARACGCYSVIKREYDRLLGPDKTLDEAGVQGRVASTPLGCGKNPLMSS
jgi:CRP-like cAMP-binding protein